MKIPFWKAHGAGNDFLFTFAAGLVPGVDLSTLAAAICDRHTGAGADGWYLIEKTPEADARIRLFNSDGSQAELSGNGTRCAAAVLMECGMAGPEVRIATGAGLRTLNLRGRSGMGFEFSMDCGEPVMAGRWHHDAVIVDVGNPQCAVPVQTLDFDWRSLGREIEGSPHFAGRTNVSFFRSTADHSIEARFYERGAGPTKSSGTGSLGAAAAAILLGMVRSPVEVRTEGGVLVVDWLGPGNRAVLTGPAVLVASGVFFAEPASRQGIIEEIWKQQC